MAECATCEDEGWVVEIDHEDACHEAGECVGCSGVEIQVACPACGPEVDKSASHLKSEADL